MIKILKKRKGRNKENHICHFKKIHYCLCGSTHVTDYKVRHYKDSLGGIKSTLFSVSRKDTPTLKDDQINAPILNC